MRKLELLAPARDAETARAAVDYGADALYVGGPAFGARAAAGNSVGDVARIAGYARQFGVRVYAALNTLIYEDELDRARNVARGLIDAGVDALIIRDAAFMRMGLTGVEFHASTQMCNDRTEHVCFLGQSGFSRVILERGLTLDEIRGIRRHTDAGLECFVHGAICAGFSGRCHLSRSMGPRSGNRGDCMQACRLTYDLLDARGEVLLKNKHLLSVTDLDLSGRLGELIDAGVDSFKIEGRLKDAGYVRNVVAHYRQLLDGIIETRPGFVRASSGRTVADFTPDPQRSFTRGGSHWMLDGNRPGLASFDTPKAIGIHVGDVARTGSDFFEISSSVRLTAGDGICFMCGGELTGTSVNRIEGRRVYPNRMNGIGPGVPIYRNYDKAFETVLSQSRTRRVIDVRASLATREGGVTLSLTDEDGVCAEVSATCASGAAKDPAAMGEVFRTQISRSGDTVFNIKEVSISGTQMPFMPVSAVNALRRGAAELLLHNRVSRRPENHDLPREDKTAPYPCAESCELSVTNSLARQFYADHGVTDFRTAPDLLGTLDGECVMTSAYCLRMETGRCLKKSPQERGELYIRRGQLTYRLEFDCEACRMRVVKIPAPD